MTCRFLENVTLGSLIAPVSETEFGEGYWEQKPLIVHRSNPGYYDDLFTLRDFDEAITRSPNYVKLANAATNKNKSYRASLTQGLEAVLADMRDGGTLVLDQLHHREPKLGMLCRLLATQLGHRFQTNLYLTPPNGKGFTPHWDNHDVFILQVFGSKHWKIEKQRRTFPDRNDKMGDSGRELRGDVSAFTLHQGDIIYIPRGFVHAAECGAEASLHITLGVTAFFLQDLLHAIVRAAVQRDERLRVALPLGFMQADRDSLAQMAMAALRQASSETFLDEIVDQYRDELVAQFPLDIAGQVEDFFQSTPLALEDIVGPRRGIIYQKHAGDDSVRLNFGGRSIVFPGFFRDALDFALNTPAFAIREIAGELEDEERIVFVERLMQEGLVVRKQGRAA
jgi:ribosomal protein L16 Arg81 hydroxylase